MSKSREIVPGQLLHKKRKIRQIILLLDVTILYRRII
ncbi:hypothetical protein OSIRIS_57 [Brevibacillus phage Osiris]|uniref:Uncharacterized protein n=1 Tax=Brevibacillus phage Osiris TaxID=1691955 RepID=A0A0K2CNJ7_9CAUD|nr:hypothetical protein AVV10_gp057 [Brevibacillus phage Osiris]ALA07341.1 hypothetical protein OSIRIS_57 [Brevibacillus phage Osiris]